MILTGDLEISRAGDWKSVGSYDENSGMSCVRAGAPAAARAPSPTRWPDPRRRVRASAVEDTRSSINALPCRKRGQCWLAVAAVADRRPRPTGFAYTVYGLSPERWVARNAMPSDGVCAAFHDRTAWLLGTAETIAWASTYYSFAGLLTHCKHAVSPLLFSSAERLRQR